MPVRPASKSVLTLAADGDRADAARRALLADWCRLVGRRVAGVSDSPSSGPQSNPKIIAHGPRNIGATGAGQHPGPIATPAAAPFAPAPAAPAAAIAALGLPPRQSQILAGLLAGGSEKQIALGLSISPHTVHTYVKQLHKRLGVCSRGELLARFIGPNA